MLINGGEKRTCTMLLDDLSEIKAVLDVEAKMMRALMMLAAIRKLQSIAV